VNTKHWYQSEASAAIKLTAREREAAKELLKVRPEVMPGTRVCVNRADQVVWFHMVVAKMSELGVPSERVTPFCDLVGVPD
jgi:hypothetical protein